MTHSSFFCCWSVDDAVVLLSLPSGGGTYTGTGRGRWRGCGRGGRGRARRSWHHSHWIQPFSMIIYSESKYMVTVHRTLSFHDVPKSSSHSIVAENFRASESQITFRKYTTVGNGEPSSSSGKSRHAGWRYDMYDLVGEIKWYDALPKNICLVKTFPKIDVPTYFGILENGSDDDLPSPLPSILWTTDEPAGRWWRKSSYKTLLGPVPKMTQTQITTTSLVVHYFATKKKRSKHENTIDLYISLIDP